MRPNTESTANMFAGRTLLSLYGGVGNCCIAVTEGGGDACLIDLAKDPRNDLSNRVVAKQVAAVVSQLYCLGIDMLCNTWSRARRAPVWSSMPSALRDNNHLFGLPHLNERDRSTVRKHNFMYRKCIEYATLSIDAKCSGWIGNPGQVCVGRPQE